MTAGGRLSRVALAGVVVLALCPTLLVRMPAMVDYPNHLARMYVLSRSGTPQAHPVYHVAWALAPNLAMDGLVPWLARFTGVEAAARAFLVMSQLLVVGGAAALEWVAKRRLQLAPVAAGLFLYSLPFAWGFLNFEFAVGLALCGVAAATSSRERAWPLRLAVHALAAAALVLAHLFALGLYGVTVAVLECERAAARRAPPWAVFGQLLGRLALLALPALAALGAVSAAGGSVGQPGTAWLLALKPGWVVAVANGYRLAVSCGIVLVLLVLGVTLARRGALRLTRAGAWLGTAYGLLYVGMPGRLRDTSLVDVRVLVMAAFVLPAFLTVEWPTPQWRRTTTALVGALVVGNVATVAAVWGAYQGEYATTIRSFRHLARGARVLVGHSGAGDDPPMRDLADYSMYHAPVLAVHYADAFVPDLFIQPGKQPLTLDPAYRRFYIPYGGPVPSALLASVAAGRTPARRPARRPMSGTGRATTTTSTSSARRAGIRCRPSWTPSRPGRGSSSTGCDASAERRRRRRDRRRAGSRRHAVLPSASAHSGTPTTGVRRRSTSH